MSQWVSGLCKTCKRFIQGCLPAACEAAVEVEHLVSGVVEQKPLLNESLVGALQMHCPEGFWSR